MQYFLGVAGPLIALAGAVLLAADIVRAPLDWYRFEFFGVRSLRVLRADHEAHIERLRQLPVPPYTPEAIEDLVRESNAEFSRREHEALDRLGDAKLNRLFLSRTLGFWGVVLIGLGSLAQSIAAYLGWVSAAS